MRASILLASALASGALAAPQLAARTFDHCKPNPCLEKVLALLPIHPNFCINFDVNILNMELVGFLQSEVSAACQCATQHTGTATTSINLPSSKPVTSTAAPTSDSGSVTTSAESKPTTVAPGTTTRKCKGKPSTSGSPPGYGPGPTGGATPPTTATTTSSAAVSTPTNGGNPGTCTAAQWKGGDLSVLGALMNNAGMTLESLAGTAGAEVFNTEKSLVGIANGVLGTVIGALGAVEHLRERTLDSGNVAASVGVSSALGHLIPGNTNFLQITGQLKSATQSVCQKVSLCKGTTYKWTLSAVADLEKDALLQFQWGDNHKVSETFPIHAGRQGGAGIEFTFTWDNDSILAAPLCLLTTIADDLQSIGLWNIAISAL